MISIKYIAFIGLAVIALSSRSQNATDDLGKVAKKYMTATQLSMDMVVTTFSSENHRQGEVLGEAIMRMQGNRYYSRFLTDEMISDEQGTLIIDRHTREMTYFDRPLKQRNRSLYSLDIDSLLEQSDSVVFRGKKNNMLGYSLYHLQSVIIRTDLSIDATNDLIKKITYYYRPSDDATSYDMHKVVIDYRKVHNGPVPDRYFDLSGYITRTGRVIALKEPYNGYRLILAGNNEDL